MLRGIRIFAIFAFAIIVGYGASELSGTPRTEQGRGLIALLLVSVSGLITLGLLEVQQFKRADKKKHRFGSSHHTNKTAAQTSKAGYSSFYSARPNDEAWRVQKQGNRQRRSKLRK